MSMFVSVQNLRCFLQMAIAACSVSSSSFCLFIGGRQRTCFVSDLYFFYVVNYNHV